MPVITKPLLYANTATWNGSGTATVTVDFGFQPDLVWIKPRNNVASNANSHILIDSVRGVDKVLRSQTDAIEVTESNNIVAFTSTGITIGDSHNVNKNTTSQYVAWAWKKGATQGFDIVTYTGTGANRTVAHNLGVAPSMIIVKARNLPNSIARSWTVWHSALSATEVIFLNQTSAKQTGATTYWNSTLPTSSVFSLGTEPTVNGAIGTVGEYVAYLFAEVAGFSKFGSYTGNGSADGPFVFCGFRPRFVMWKNASASQAWLIEDTSRSTYNEVALELYPSSSGAEAAGSSRSPTQQFDFLSNGFKVRGAQEQTNGSGNTIIFAAFAEHPFKNALAR